MTSSEPTSWTIHLAARRPWRALVAVVLILFALVAVGGISRSVPVVIVAALLLFGSIAEFLFPVDYTLDADGAHSRHLGSHRLLPWSHVRRVYLRPDGIKLSPLTTRSWADGFRGVMLRSPRREVVLADVLRWLAETGNAPEVVEEK